MMNMAGRHNAKTTETSADAAPQQWVPEVVEATPSGDGPAQYREDVPN
jgi:hypothetical protein